MNIKILVLVIDLALGVVSVPTVRADVDSVPGELVLFPGSRRPPPSIRPNAARAHVLLTTLDALWPELDREQPPGVREGLLRQTGELIAGVWAHGIPNPRGEWPPALRRLVDASRAGEREANLGLSLVINGLTAHAMKPADPDARLGTDRALQWLGHIRGPLAATALLAIVKDAPDKHARETATSILGVLAHARSELAYAEACTALILGAAP